MDDKIATAMFWVLLALLAIVVVISGPILTSDGLAHVSMAHFMVHADDPAWPMLNRLYERNPTPSPNALGDLLMAGLMRCVPPLAAEQIVQVLCLVSIPLAARITLRRLAPEAGWLALFFFPVALQRMFFLGLYNFSLSMTGGILCVWAYLRLRTHGSLGNAVVLAVLLSLTLACQASGWIEAVLALGTMQLTETWLQWRAGERGWPLGRSLAILLLCGAPGGLLFALFALGGSGDRHVAYGPSVPERLAGVFRGDAFAPIGQSTALVSLLLGLILLGMALTSRLVPALARGRSKRSTVSPAERDAEARAHGYAEARAEWHAQGSPLGSPLGSPQAHPQAHPGGHAQGHAGVNASWRMDESARRLRIAMCLLPITFLGFLLVMPDEAGGGWTHTQRAQAFPYIGLALACATLPIGRHISRLAAIAAAIGAIVMIGMTVWVQVWQVPPVVREFDEAETLIGPHCTIAPVLTHFKLDEANSARLFYHPLFHLANRFELRADRPVLFSYIARLPIYAVQFRPNADPQRLLYRWEPSQRDTRVRQIDIPAFEAASGIPVDYVLLWDFPAPDDPGPWHDIRSAVIHGPYALVHKSSGGRMELYRRTGAGGCAKQ